LTVGIVRNAYAKTSEDELIRSLS